MFVQLGWEVGQQPLEGTDPRETRVPHALKAVLPFSLPRKGWRTLGGAGGGDRRGGIRACDQIQDGGDHSGVPPTGLQAVEGMCWL